MLVAQGPLSYWLTGRVKNLWVLCVSLFCNSCLLLLLPRCCLVRGHSLLSPVRIWQSGLVQNISRGFQSKGVATFSCRLPALVGVPSPENFGEVFEGTTEYLEWWVVSGLEGEYGVAWYIWVTTWPLAWYSELKWVMIYPVEGGCDLLCAINVS